MKYFWFLTGTFDFTTSDSAFYGYVKVVDDIGKIEIEAIKKEVEQFVPQKQEFVDYSGFPSSHIEKMGWNTFTEYPGV